MTPWVWVGGVRVVTHNIPLGVYIPAALATWGGALLLRIPLWVLSAGPVPLAAPGAPPTPMFAQLDARWT
ncbi:hypothetical protein B1R94_19350 [Mycolicibacterium litorale]|nr:hypothetical protein B1R94_19350 [Mycolicibacterium litorale]